MGEWDGRGLPPIAAQRARRAAEGGAWTSLLTVPAAAGLADAGFDPVGEVMGSMVAQIGWAGYRGCAGYGWGVSTATITSSDADRFAGFRPYVDALDRGYAAALGRMAQEAAIIGADGVVGITLDVERFAGNSREFTALGTAVRARSTTRPAQIFRTSLPGEDVAKLVRAGWMPTDLVYGISVAIRHDDWATRQQAGWGSGNTEVAGYTELVTTVRADARRKFTRHVARGGSDGAVVSSMGLNVWHVEPTDNHRDHVAEATVFGTSLVRFHTGRVAPTRSLTYLPLR